MDDRARERTRSKTREAIRSQVANRIALYELPGHRLTLLNELYQPINRPATENTAESGSQQPDDPPPPQHPAPVPPKTPAGKMSNIVKVPKFGGDNFRKWYNDFENCMLLLDCDENNAKQAKFFKVNLIEGSAAAIWYETIPAEAKTDWSLLVPLLRNRFDNSIEDKRSAFRTLSTTKLTDKDIGLTTSNGEFKHVEWARTIAIAKERSGQDPDNLNAFLVMNNMGPHIQSLLIATGSSSSVSDICAKVESLTPNEIETIREMVKRETETAEMRSEVAQLKKQLQRQPLGASQQQSQQQNSFQQSTWAQQSLPDRDNSVRVEPGPFPPTAEGHIRYKQAIQNFYRKYGEGATASLSRPFPLSPGTEPAGSNECFNCGLSSHLRPQCTASYRLPDNEQRYRGSVMKQKREMNVFSGSAQQQGKPIRFISHANSYEREFRHLASMPLSPPMQLGDLYESDAGNDEGPHP
ncbi:hypothetical protein HD553DRAFT_341806 [Filobasidium floriforme]|uniref:uncharacterized protein n=1 Tax=Filobasidium floriforme TaxID=5210 RepID=UPI001E8D96F0|nr:uncharacterized protein HD553DRAFT_341806 [Filobasidium floriforme]KAH8085184.1 hypothetical protein HD553DRAFT_341806 [Filobasidium floriforme]